MGYYSFEPWTMTDKVCLAIGCILAVVIVIALPITVAWLCC